MHTKGVFSQVFFHL